MYGNQRTAELFCDIGERVFNACEEDYDPDIRVDDAGEFPYCFCPWHPEDKYLHEYADCYQRKKRHSDFAELLSHERHEACRT